jgi:hypothetical protein
VLRSPEPTACKRGGALDAKLHCKEAPMVLAWILIFTIVLTCLIAIVVSAPREKSLEW